MSTFFAICLVSWKLDKFSISKEFPVIKGHTLSNKNLTFLFLYIGEFQNLVFSVLWFLLKFPLASGIDVEHYLPFFLWWMRLLVHLYKTGYTTSLTSDPEATVFVWGNSLCLRQQTERWITGQLVCFPHFLFTTLIGIWRKRHQRISWCLFSRIWWFAF